jgi:hypothetical protein
MSARNAAKRAYSAFIAPPSARTIFRNSAFSIAGYYVLDKN